ncbi:hypothetical protein J6590_040028 [Homalodisca vitripennis]|nr:hypothetical protein J6590_040028 [Homalodisca vitripennis]
MSLNLNVWLCAVEAAELTRHKYKIYLRPAGRHVIARVIICRRQRPTLRYWSGSLTTVLQPRIAPSSLDPLRILPSETDPIPRIADLVLQRLPSLVTVSTAPVSRPRVNSSSLFEF